MLCNDSLGSGWFSRKKGFFSACGGVDPGCGGGRQRGGAGRGVYCKHKCGVDNWLMVCEFAEDPTLCLIRAAVGGVEL